VKNINERTFNFAVRIVRLCRFLEQQSGVEQTISKQLLRSGTSIGANVEEAQAGQSKPDFISKMSIALKESRETLYWLRILETTEVVVSNKLNDLKVEAEEITKGSGFHNRFNKEKCIMQS